MCLFIEAVEILEQPYLLAHTSNDPQMIQALHGKIRHADPFRREVARVSHASGESVKSISQKSLKAAREHAEDGSHGNFVCCRKAAASGHSHPSDRSLS
jgi:hypothetical protein